MSGKIYKSIQKGYPLLLGANRTSDGCCFALEAPRDAEVSLLLYYKGEELPSVEIPFGEDTREGRIFTMCIKGFDTRVYTYNYKVNGKVVHDPCTYRILGKEQFGVLPEDTDHGVRCGFLVDDHYDWEEDRHPELQFSDMVLYKTHVRGYTKLAKLSPSKKGTFAGLTDMIPYWKELGVNAIELMPFYEFDEVLAEEKEKNYLVQIKNSAKVNYWGYTNGYYFAPKKSYCATKKPEKEIRDFIKALHREGMECIMEFCFPAGINPLMALRALQFWRLYYHIDGFHVMGDGVPMNLLLMDGILGRTKIFSTGFDDFLAQKRYDTEGKLLAEYHNGYMQSMRRFLKSDEDTLEGAIYHIRHNNQKTACVNYIVNQDGFTMSDMVTYTYKHNEKNGENNQDGNNYNYSWNCGVEGPSRKTGVRVIRERQIRNAFLMLMLSQGIPMLYGGDEFGNSQEGNNNAWCQDNETGWIDWRSFRKNSKLVRFVKEAVAFRKEHPILHMEQPFAGTDYKAKGYPDFSVHGERAWYCPGENTSRLLGVMYYGPYAMKEDGTEDDILYTAYNFHWENRSIALPNLPNGMKWVKIVDTSEKTIDRSFYLHDQCFEKLLDVSPRTIIILQAKRVAAAPVKTTKTIKKRGTGKNSTEES